MVFAEVGADLLEVAFDPQTAGLIGQAHLTWVYGHAGSAVAVRSLKRLVVNLDYLQVAREYTRHMLRHCQNAWLN
jgi:hypothetical protein